MSKIIENKITALIEMENVWISQIFNGDFTNEEIDEEIEKMNKWEIFEISNDNNRVTFEHASFLYIKKIIYY